MIDRAAHRQPQTVRRPNATVAPTNKTKNLWNVGRENATQNLDSSGSAASGSANFRGIRDSFPSVRLQQTPPSGGVLLLVNELPQPVRKSAKVELRSFPRFGIEAHGFWTVKADAQLRLFVLASYAADMEPGEVAGRYMKSTEFAEDIRGFDVANIVDVESTILIPLTSSPLK